MGSLNYDGSTITRYNISYRNIGGAVTKTPQELPNTEQTLVSLNFDKSSIRGTTPDVDEVQYSTLGESSFRKVTRSTDDTLISRNSTKVVVAASEQPELTNIALSQYHEAHNGKKIIIADSKSDAVIIRNDSRGAYDG